MSRLMYRTGTQWKRARGDLPTPTVWYGWDVTSTTEPPDLAQLPNPYSTGIPPGTGTLTVVNGDLTLTPGEVLDKVHVTGDLTLSSFALVKRSHIEGRITGGFSGARVWACDLGRISPAPDEGKVGFRYDRTHYKRNNIYGYTDSMQFNGVDMLVEDSFFHNSAVSNDSGQPNGVSHNDHIQILGGSNHQILHNTFYSWSFDTRAGETCTRESGPHWGQNGAPGLFTNGYQTSTILVNVNGIDAVTVDRNLFLGAPSKHIIDGSDATNVTITNNRFGRDARDYNPASVNGNNIARNGTETITGNVYHDTGVAM